MKNALLLIFISYNSLLFSQFGEQRIISNTVDFPYKAIPLDLDFDGDLDILSAGMTDHLLRWFKNEDGQGAFASEIILNHSEVLYLDIQFFDNNGDGFNDIVYLENNPRRIGILQNINGTDMYSDPLVLHQSSSIYRSFNPHDFDNDGDIDLILQDANTITWLENLDGLGSYANEVVLANTNLNFFKIIIEDLDNDGYVDIFTSLEQYLPSTLIWYKNMGDGTLGNEQTIFEFQSRPASDWYSLRDLALVDINTDGLKDIYLTAVHDDWDFRINLLENVGDVTFAAPMTFDFGYKFHDIDRDGDIDILNISGFTNDLISWRENIEGSGDFSENKIITTLVDDPTDANVGDIDGDGLLDIISSSRYDNKIAWYKNTGVLHIDENEFLSIKLYPNPTTGLLTLKTSESIAKVIVRDALGKTIFINEINQQIDVSNYSSGVYFIEIINSSGISQIKKFIKK